MRETYRGKDVSKVVLLLVQRAAEKRAIINPKTVHSIYLNTVF
jgi:hypothetical protein